MSTLYDTAPVQFFESLAWTVKVKVPGPVGIPERTPALESVSPLGRVPIVTVKVYGLLPPLAVMVWLYAAVVVPSGSACGFIVIVGQVMVIVYDRVPLQPLLAVALTVKVKLPLADGVPERTPAVDRLSPPGRVPLDTVKVYGLLPPLAVMVWLYAAVVVPSGSACGFIVIVGQVMVIVYDRVPLQPLLAVALTVKVKLPLADGVPERTPAVDRLSPPGRLPLDTVKVYGLLPPLAVMVWLY